MGSGSVRIRRARAGTRYSDDFVRGAGDCDPGVVWHCDVPDRAIAHLFASAARHGHRDAGGDPVDHLWHVGALHLRAVLPAACPAVDDRMAWPDSGHRLAVFGGAVRDRHLYGRAHPVDHDHALHRGGHARRLRDRTPDAQGVRLRAWRNNVGSHVARGAALYPQWRDWRHHAGPRAGAWRNHGRHVRHRQRFPDAVFVVLPGQLDCFGAG